MVRNVKGFTMVELMIVIAIIGVLAVALIPTFIGAQSKARDTGRAAALANASTSLASFNNDNGYFPGTMNGCLTDTNGSVSVNAYYSNAATPAVITTVAAYFQGGRAGVDPQAVTIGAGAAPTAANRSLNCLTSKSFAYQTGRSAPSKPDYSSAILVAKMETEKLANATALPGAATANGQLTPVAPVTVASTDPTKLYVKVVE